MKYMVRRCYEVYDTTGKTVRLEIDEMKALRYARDLNEQIGQNFDIEQERARMHRRQSEWD